MSVPDPQKLEFPKLLEPLREVHGAHRAFRIFTKMVACTLSSGQREEEYMKEAKHLTPEQLEAVGHAFGSFIMECESFPYTDLLGPCYEHVAHSMDRSDRGEFYTPPEVSALMSRLTMPKEWPEDGHLCMHEPSGGTGGTILTFVEEMANRKITPDRVFVETWDISEGSCDCAYINLALWGVPARIVWGDTLRMNVRNEWRTPFRPREKHTDWTEFWRAYEAVVAGPNPGSDYGEREGRLFA